MFITKEETKTHNIYKIGKVKIGFRKSKTNNNIFVVDNNVWLAKTVTILKNTKITNGCIVATSSVVTKDCLIPNSIYAGSPAKINKRKHQVG